MFTGREQEVFSTWRAYLTHEVRMASSICANDPIIGEPKVKGREFGKALAENFLNSPVGPELDVSAKMFGEELMVDGYSLEEDFFFGFIPDTLADAAGPESAVGDLFDNFLETAGHSATMVAKVSKEHGLVWREYNLPYWLRTPVPDVPLTLRIQGNGIWVMPNDTADNAPMSSREVEVGHFIFN